MLDRVLAWGKGTNKLRGAFAAESCSSGRDLFVWMAEFLSEETALRVLFRNGPLLSRSCSSVAAALLESFWWV